MLRDCGADSVAKNLNLPPILNVTDLGGGKTGIILRNGGYESLPADLIEYEGGVDATDMRKL